MPTLPPCKRCFFLLNFKLLFVFLMSISISSMFLYHKRRDLLTNNYNNLNFNFNSTQFNSNDLLCPLIPVNLTGRIKVNLTIPKSQVAHANLRLGGQWRPHECLSRHKIAIIVPYRDRSDNLELFLAHMHPFLAKQQLDYGIYLVEPVDNVTFNRGLLMNIGFAEALEDKENDWQCFAFHDVDLLPEDDRNLYSCPESPRHMSSAVSTLNYRLPYEDIFGGVTSFSKQQFQHINGFSNLFFGWGGEDDDLAERVSLRGYKVSRYPLAIGRYHMAKHSKDKPNPERFRLLESSQKRMNIDGIASLDYELVAVNRNKFYTKVTVNYDKNRILSQFFKNASQPLNY